MVKIVSVKIDKCFSGEFDFHSANDIPSNVIHAAPSVCGALAVWLRSNLSARVWGTNSMFSDSVGTLTYNLSPGLALEGVKVTL